MFEEIHYQEKKNKLNLYEMVEHGLIYVVRNYIPLKKFINEHSIFFNTTNKLNKINTEEFLKINQKLIEFKENGLFSNIFLEFIKNTDIDFAMSQIDIGNPRIVFPENSMKNEIKKISSLLNIKNSCFRKHLSPPHRDLNRPHYNSQFNFWWSFHDLEENESLVFFPEAYKKQIFPYMKNYKLDANAHSEKFAEVSKNFSYKDYKLGKPLQFKLKCGDFLFFNSEHYHCSAKKVNKNRVSCELRFVDKAFDNNDHYVKDSFYYIKNFTKQKNETLYSLFKKFDTLNKKKQNSLFFKFDEDIRVKLLLNNKLNYKISFIQKFKLLFQIRSFYFLEKIFTLEPFFTKFIFKIKLNYLSKNFIKNDFRFDKNPVNYFKKGHHSFNQPTPSLFEEKINEMIRKLSVVANSK